MDFERFFFEATGHSPYPWQATVARDGLPELIDVETGAGKTAGVVLGWLWRRLHMSRDGCGAPSWLVLAFPMRSLVDQTSQTVKEWTAKVAPAVETCVLRGGDGRIDRSWRDRPGRPTVIVGTIDMLVSRALNRGYVSNRWVWPVEFGLLNSDCHWVFDEVQLMGPTLATSRQLDAFRRMFGTLARCNSTWMSATVCRETLRTVDNRDLAATVVLSPADREDGELKRRLGAIRTIREITIPGGTRYDRSLASTVLTRHRPGTRTLVIVNTVQRAISVFRAISKEIGQDGPRCDLLHSRFRPYERNHMIDSILNTTIDPSGPGAILVSTQVVEAGVDISSAVLITEAAPWSSIVQRAGRCNRDGEVVDTELWWTEPPGADPYTEHDIGAAAEALRAREGRSVTSTELRENAHNVATLAPIYPTLRKRDLSQLFDTSPDLIGNDVDVSRFIRDSDDVDVFACWRESAELSHSDRPDETSGAEMSAPFKGGPIQSEEMCRVRIGEARTWLKGKRAWVLDPGSRRSRWVPLRPDLLRPGTLIVVDAMAGGYDSVLGFSPNSTKLVDCVPDAAEPGDPDRAPIEESVGDDPATPVGEWIRLVDHLRDAAEAASQLVDEVAWEGLDDRLKMAVTRAAALHDIGKAHPVFQETLRRAMPKGESERLQSLGPLAKSAEHLGRHERRYFRHELVSGLMVRAHETELIGDLDERSRALVAYLVAAHHGRVRMAIRSLPGEEPPRDRSDARIALGVVDGDNVPLIDIGDRQVPPTTMDLSVMELGQVRSWDAMIQCLVDDVGPFKLAGLEALVRLSDWRASARGSSVTGDRS